MSRESVCPTRTRMSGHPCPHLCTKPPPMRRAARLAASVGAAAASSSLAAAPGADRPSFQPCPEVSCSSKEELAARFFDGGADAGGGSRRPGRRRSPPPPAPPAPPPAQACPPAREELGAATWTLLHAVAAYYPVAPSEEQRAAALGLVEALRVLYPCAHCRAQLALDLERLPPRVGSRAELCEWVCQQHNLVNELLGKPAFDCSERALDERWRSGRRDCWAPAGGGAGGQTAEESLGQPVSLPDEPPSP